MTQTHDYVIVGGGTAGSVIANRLTELDDVTVAVLEAGGAEVSDAVEDPARWNEVLLTEADWAYLSEPQAGLNGRRVYRSPRPSSTPAWNSATPSSPTCLDGGRRRWSHCRRRPYRVRRCRFAVAHPAPRSRSHWTAMPEYRMRLGESCLP